MRNIINYIEFEEREENNVYELIGTYITINGKKFKIDKKIYDFSENIKISKIGGFDVVLFRTYRSEHTIRTYFVASEQDIDKSRHDSHIIKRIEYSNGSIEEISCVLLDEPIILEEYYDNGEVILINVYYIKDTKIENILTGEFRNGNFNLKINTNVYIKNIFEPNNINLVLMKIKRDEYGIYFESYFINKIKEFHLQFL